jgi:hypothetical protein
VRRYGKDRRPRNIGKKKERGCRAVHVGHLLVGAAWLRRQLKANSKLRVVLSDDRDRAGLARGRLPLLGRCRGGQSPSKPPAARLNPRHPTRGDQQNSGRDRHERDRPGPSRPATSSNVRGLSRFISPALRPACPCPHRSLRSRSLAGWPGPKM